MAAAQVTSSQMAITVAIDAIERREEVLSNLQDATHSRAIVTGTRAPETAHCRSRRRRKLGSELRVSGENSATKMCSDARLEGKYANSRRFDDTSRPRVIVMRECANRSKDVWTAATRHESKGDLGDAMPDGVRASRKDSVDITANARVYTVEGARGA